ncbi:uncharacterized protein LACBIDRAFT_336136 [Laccaria bicolor S238N-H82]|uniref:Predicted protein n=1 Tax=Laccaria bicolor (strain S238N-H82 / ATCC MYA-4686) TaxID=486041 RepID=B0E4H8_LACBS|nr:uncharacterized protein LACBIDRAFT_336136 [Laccaria bicolor S238N-H82]EDQ98254.1 predicted protein [Laccaria bicolor S238N-H82]|eukprot:XP_001891096.1 predicted protein [Laccaria bicolor S238N-H82]
MAAFLSNALRRANHLEFQMLKCMRTEFRQRLVTGLRPYSHASASSSRTDDEKSGTRSHLRKAKTLLAVTGGTASQGKRTWIHQESTDIHLGSAETIAYRLGRSLWHFQTVSQLSA